MRGRLRVLAAAAGAALAVGLFTPLVGWAQIKAFPQAEGFGAAAKGGRGGDVYHVTNLNDSGVGSLRYGIDNAPTSGRTIVFDVGGWINIASKLGINSDKRNITIAGQTAPGGIGIRGNQFSVGGDDIVIRHMRFRPGKAAGSNTDSAGANVDAERIIYDHISAEFSTDGGFDSQATDLTLQYSSVSFGLQTHSTGSLLENARRFTMHHNLYAHNDTRNPKHRVWEALDWVDNIVYNWNTRAVHLQGTEDLNYQWSANFDGNYFIAGPDHIGQEPISGERESIDNFETWWGTNAYDFNGNTAHDGEDYSYGDVDFSIVAEPNATRWRSTPFPVADEVWRDDSTQAAYERVLSEFGATPWARDEVNQLLHNTVVNRNGNIITRESDLVSLGVTNGGFGTLGGGAAALDTDQDGIPNAWEMKHGTNPNVASNNGDFDKDGFTDLEEYLNDLAAFKAVGPLEFSGIGRYADWKRWTNRWEPSKVDDVHVDSGAAFVDAVGQKAGTLRIGSAAGSDGLVYVTSGWLEVTDDVVLGGEGTGTLEQYGGELRVLSGDVAITDGEYVMRGGTLRTPGLFRGPNGQFEMSGGVLSADVVGFELVNDGGVIAPGSSIGTTSVVGDLTLNSGGVQIDLLSSLSADSLLVDGVATLGGVLDVQLLDGFVPSGGQSWKILTAGGIVGSFESVTPGFDVQQIGNSLWLLASSGAGGLADLSVPEPAGLVLVSIAVVSALTRRRVSRRLAAVALLGSIGLVSPAAADTLKVTADAELRENSTDTTGVNATDSGAGTGSSLNARWTFSGDSTNRNEWIALKFDLSAYGNKSLLENVAIRTTMFRSNTNNNKNLRLYALTPGTSGEDWDEATITYGSMPGFTFDANSTTNILDVGGALQSLGTFGVSGFAGEGNVAEIDPASLTTFVKNMGSNNLLTLLISTQDSTSGQWRIASREATATETSVLTGPAGTFAPYLQFDVVSNGIKGDYNNDGVIDAVDYTVWRNKLGTPGLMNEEVSPGETDIADYLYWRLRYGATDPGGAGGIQGIAAVPEPSAAAFVLIVVLVALVVRR